MRMTGVSLLTGRRTNRFTRIHQSTADLVAKHKMGRLLGSPTGRCLTESMHGADSPQAQRIVIAREVNMRAKQATAKRLCGIPEE